MMVPVARVRGEHQSLRAAGLAALKEATPMIKDVDINQLLAESARLPTMPIVASELLAISEWDDVDLRKVGDIISKDVSLASKVLRVVNSPFYGFPREISSVSQALVMLGVRATRSLCLSFSILSVSPREKTSQFDYAGFWTRSLNTATAARELTLVEGLQTGEAAFLAGLLQDIGVMVLAHCVPQSYAVSLSKAKDKLAPSPEIEREDLGMDHVEVAKLLFDKWNLPPSLCIPVLYHHRPDEAKDADDRMLASIRIQYFAGRLGEWLYTAEDSKESLEKLNEIAARYFDLSPEELEAFMYRLDRKVEETSAVFEITVPRPDSYANLLEKANAALGDIASEQERLVRELEVSRAEAQKLSQQLRAANNKLLEDSRKDPLTNLANRRMCRMLLDRELERCTRYEHPVALLFIDVDDFKSLNDRHGHLQGDAALRQIAKILRREVRATDVVARYGGEEFVIALVETRESDAKVIAERIRRAIEETPLMLNDRHTQVRLTASIGVAAWEPTSEPTTSETLVEKADSAMYQSKRAGKNRVVVWEPHGTLVR